MKSAVPPPIQNVYSNFTRYIEAGSTTFTIENPNSVRDGINRLYSFGYLDLVPDYVAEVAEAEDMDDRHHNPNVHVHKVRFSAYYTSEYLNPRDRKITSTIKKGDIKMCDIINLFNSGAEENKPPGMIFCPFFLDWTYPGLDRAVDFRKAAEDNAMAYYGETTTFDPLRHRGFLPASVDGPYNEWELPTNPIVLNKSRIRLTLQPGYKLSMSNELLLKEMGFTSEMYGERGAHNQFHIQNNSLRPYTFVARGPPKGIANLTKDVSVTATLTDPKGGFSINFQSSAKKDKEVLGILKEIGDWVTMEGKTIFGYPFSLTMNEDNKIVFKGPVIPGAHFSLTLPDALLIAFKFRPGYVIDYRNFQSEASIFPKKMTPEEGIALAKILVLDTGPLTVTLSDAPSITTRGRSNHLMAFLGPNGSRSSMIEFIRPVAYFPSQVPTLTFKIDRNSDRSEIIGLNWPVGCTVNGLMVGVPYDS